MQIMKQMDTGHKQHCVECLQLNSLFCLGSELKVNNLQGLKAMLGYMMATALNVRRNKFIGGKQITASLHKFIYDGWLSLSSLSSKQWQNVTRHRGVRMSRFGWILKKVINTPENESEQGNYF